MSDPSPTALLRRFYSHLSGCRKRQFRRTCMLMLLGAIAELVTVGAVVPFLALVAGSAQQGPLGRLTALAATAAGKAGTTAVTLAAALLVVTALLSAGIRMLVTWRVQALVFDIGHEVSTQLYARTLHRPYAYHLTRKSGSLVVTIAGVRHVVATVLLPVLQLLTSSAVGLVLVSAFFALDPAIAAIATLSLTVPYALLSLLARARMRANSFTIARGLDAEMLLLREGIGGIRDILLGSFQPMFIRSFAAVGDRLRDARRQNTFIAVAPRFVAEAGGVIVIALAGVLVSRQAGGLLAALPVLGAMAVGAQRLLPLAQQIYSGIASVTSNAGQLADLCDLMDEKGDEKGDEKESAVPALPRPEPLAFSESLEFRNVWYRYPASTRHALRSVSLELKKGARIGLVGRTGSGKSTFVDVLSGLLSPTLGEIRVDGKVLGGGALPAWQARIAHVPQTPFILDGTIAANIAFEVEPGAIDMERVRRAARAAEIDEFVCTLPRRYQSSVGENGVALSGGQRQRIAIARALYQERPILVLDEITSALDERTEAALMDNIRRLPGDVTVVIVSHRPAALACCGQVFHVEDGTIAAAAFPGGKAGAAPPSSPRTQATGRSFP